jgi:hypothetical protein
MKGRSCPPTEDDKKNAKSPQPPPRGALRIGNRLPASAGWILRGMGSEAKSPYLLN